MYTSIITMDDMKQKLILTMKQSFLDRHIQIPAVDEEKLFMLITIMNHTKLPTNLKTNYILAAMLVQTALDAHDLVRVNDQPTENTFSIRDQLTVLAGDYYSGLYYFLLSELDDHLMIRQLATAIKDINEHKMALYYGEAKTVYSHIQLIKQIETLLITRIADQVQCEYLGDLAEQWITVHTLIKEKDDMENGGESKWFRHSNFCGSPFYENIQQQIDQGIEYVKTHLPLYLQQDIMKQQSYSCFYDYLFGHSLNREEG